MVSKPQPGPLVTRGVIEDCERYKKALERIIELTGRIPQPTLEQALAIIIEARLEARYALNPGPVDAKK